MNIIHDKGAGGVLYYIINEISGRMGINIKNYKYQIKMIHS